MNLADNIKEKISIEVIKTLISRFDNFPENADKNRNAPFHEAFLRAFEDKIKNKVSDIPFFLSLSSWMQGLNTTLGQTFFENVAHHISSGEKREYTSKKLGNLKIFKNQKDNINSIITDLSNGNILPNKDNENKLIFVKGNGLSVSAIDFSADVFLEEKDRVVAIELKSVKPNSGEMRGEKQKILEGKAALYKIFPGKEIHFFIGFPFDPTSSIDTAFNKDRFLRSIINMSKYFAPEETLLSGELWDFLSGIPNTMEQILEIINIISTTKFLEKYQFLNNIGRKKDEYIKLLNEWNLFSEIELIKNDEILRERIGENKRLIRLYNQKLFDNKGIYNINRYDQMIRLISN